MLLKTSLWLQFNVQLKIPFATNSSQVFSFFACVNYLILIQRLSTSNTETKAKAKANRDKNKNKHRPRNKF